MLVPAAISVEQVPAPEPNHFYRGAPYNRVYPSEWSPWRTYGHEWPELTVEWEVK